MILLYWILLASKYFFSYAKVMFGFIFILHLFWLLMNANVEL
jgi:hypothetical protein